ncbi:MAG: glycosyltransferase [Actinobacteria bacterium]|nr:glycosyltransferase [Actinomycetota bacterium]
MTSTVRRRRPVFDHLDALTDERGLFEHALFDSPRPEHGYCLDDVARGLVVTSREPRPSPVVARLHKRYLDFVLAATDADGTCHNRMGPDGAWRDRTGVGDWWGRAIWGLGVAAAHSPTAGQRARALAGFRVAAQQRSPFGRAMAFAALGAGEVLRTRPGEPTARALLRDAVDVVDPPVPARRGVERGWPWPEPRLRYANAAVAEALLVAGDALANKVVRSRGLELLAYLLRIEVCDKHLSVTPVAGRGPGELGPGFDQQPVEVAAIADACATAYRITSDPRWLTGISLAWRWFLGDNDSRSPMFDPATGGGYDGLQADGPNLNQGAESTLAMLSTAQHSRHTQELR